MSGKQSQSRSQVTTTPGLFRPLRVYCPQILYFHTQLSSSSVVTGKLIQSHQKLRSTHVTSCLHTRFYVDNGNALGWATTRLTKHSEQGRFYLSPLAMMDASPPPPPPLIPSPRQVCICPMPWRLELKNASEKRRMVRRLGKRKTQRRDPQNPWHLYPNNDLDKMRRLFW